MILRVVKMKVDLRKIDAFKLFMDNLHDEKLRLAGCLHFDYFNERQNPSIYYSYTIWEHEKYLKQYKKTEFSKEVLQTLRDLCVEEPQAWTIQNVFNKPSDEDESNK